ncbi:MAG: ribonuclease P protein component 4 [Halobacteria archaeon]|nr:ribonuclease P protein component 4 [Halobacteria archaeon]
MTKTEEEIAEERIHRLFSLADEIYHSDCDEASEYADKYVERAREIGMRCRVSLPRRLKRRVCPGCGSFLVYGDNSRVRVDDGRVAVTCQTCCETTRYPYGDGEDR